MSEVKKIVLAEFHLRNFVLLEDASLSFGPGFNAISGETGAGKSLVATALQVALGRERFSAQQIRKDSDECRLTAVFELSEKKLAEIEKTFSLDLSTAREEGLIVERIFSASGRGKASICGLTVPAATIKDLGSIILDITAQDEHGLLREASVQRTLLDSFSSCKKQAEETEKRYGRMKSLVDLIRGGRREAEARRRELEFLQHDIAELEGLEPNSEEDAKIDEKISLIANAAKLIEFCSSSIESLYESDESAVTRLGSAQHECDRLADKVESLAPASEALGSALSSLQDAVAIMRDVSDSIDTDPALLDELEERRGALLDCARKHNCEMLELSEKLIELKKREQELSELSEDAETLQPKADAAAKEFVAAALKLRAEREKGGAKLAKAIKKHLSRLGMEEADFAVRLNPLAKEKATAAELTDHAASYGLDEVVFALRANKGENWGDLSSTASGGETARALLSIKSALVAVNPCDILFFDEIDAGVGGRMGEAVAAQFAELSEKRQVIAITHLPQIAARADRHLLLSKRTTKGRTRTDAVELTGEERVTELASMIRGEKATDTTLKQAREMLAGEKK